MESALILMELVKIRALLTAFVMLAAVTLIVALVVAAVYVVRRYEKWLDADLDSIDHPHGNMSW